MQLQDLKRWHWAIVGIIVGLAFSFAFSDHDVATDTAWKDKEIKQAAFEREAFSRSHDSREPLLQNVVVEPPVLDYLKHAKQIVHGDRLRYSEKYKREYRDPFFFYADNPYTPIVVPTGSDQAEVKGIKTVMDFLAFAQKTIGPTAMTVNDARPWQAAMPIRYRFAWEYESNWNLILWALAGVVIIGGVWPTFLNLMVGAGFGATPKPKSEDDEYLSRFGKGKSEAAAASKVATDAHGERRRLDEFNAALESGLVPSGSHAAAEDATASNGATPIRPLPTDGSPAAVSEASPEPEMSEEERQKRFAAGDFYPVARGAKKG